MDELMEKMGKYYKLDHNKNIVECDVTEAFSTDRNILKSGDQEGHYVSTVFLALHHMGGMFETMIFGGPEDSEYQERCTTFEESLAQHRKACEYAGIEVGEVFEGLEKDFMKELLKL